MIPISTEAERFFVRLRQELLALTLRPGSIPPQLKPLTEALATQCFLNEYVYASSPEEVLHASKLIEAAVHSQEDTNQYLAIIGCYKAIYTTGISREFVYNYPTPNDSSKELVTAQFKEPCQEQEIKISLQENRNVTDATSASAGNRRSVPRFKFADYTDSKLANPISKLLN